MDSRTRTYMRHDATPPPARALVEETTKGLTEEQKAAVVASFNEGVSKKTL